MLVFVIVDVLNVLDDCVWWEVDVKVLELKFGVICDDVRVLMFGCDV